MQVTIIRQAVREERSVLLLYTGNKKDIFFEEVQKEALAIGCKAIAFQSEVENHLIDSKFNWLRLLFFNILGWLLFFRVENKIRFMFFRSLFVQRIITAKHILHAYNVGAVICSEDGISGELSVITAAKSMGIPVIDIPYGNGSIYDLEFDLEQKKHDGRIFCPSNRNLNLLQKHAPEWLKQGNFKNATWHQCEYILAMVSVGIKIKNAWVIHGGVSDLLCAENNVALRQYENEGIPVNKTKLTGSPYCDVMAKAIADTPAIKNCFLQPRKIEPNCTRLLISWPPSYHETYPERNEFDSFMEMSRAVFEFYLSLKNTKLTMSIHPACGSEIKALCQELGIAISDRYIISLIPQHDVFTTYFSSTIRWALACGLPVINYDAYRINLPAYNEAAAFTNAQTFDEYCHNIKKITDDNDFYEQMSKLQIANAQEWGKVDGQSIQRIFTEIDHLKDERT